MGLCTKIWEEPHGQIEFVRLFCSVACKLLKMSDLYGCGQFVRTNSICPFVFLALLAWKPWDMMPKPMRCWEETYELWWKKLWVVGEKTMTYFFNNSRWENENAEKSPDSGAKSCFFRHFCHHYRAFGKWNLLSRYPASDTLYAIVF